MPVKGDERLTFQEIAKLEGTEACDRLDSGPSGLGEAEAAARLAHYGPNQALPETVSWWDLLRRQATSPLAALLLVAALISWFIGNQIDAWVILAIYGVNVLLTFFQEFHAKQALQKLMKTLRPVARVVRGGQVQLVPAKLLVPGDVFLLEPGDIVPADARCLEVTDLAVDESLLTGESFEVLKHSAAPNKPIKNVAEAPTVVFSGTTVVRGTAKALVFATGAASQAGEILKLSALAPRRSAFETSVYTLSVFLGKLVATTLGVVFIFHLIINSTRPIGSVLVFAIALAISVIPEALPVIMSVTFARGAMQLAKRHVLVKRLSAIEDLGHIKTLCVDKTGTLTEGKMEVVGIQGETRKLLELLAVSRSRPLIKTLSSVSYDDAIERYLMREDYRLERHNVLGAIPFDPERRRSAKVVRRNGQVLLLVQGSPEEVLKVCVGSDGSKPLDHGAWLERYRLLGKKGYRTMAFAYRELEAAEYPKTSDERDLTFLGIISFEDPLRKTARQALQQARNLQVDVRILTGDSLEVAESIALKAGVLAKGGVVVSGDQWARSSSDERHQLARAQKVFARVTPQQKYEIIHVLEEDGSAVGFLGDGLNDVPALKAAQVGLAVMDAADVTKAAADFVLMRRDLHVIVEGIQLGRQIFNNVQNYVLCTLIGNFGNFYAVAFISLLIPFFPILPVQILLLNLLTDLPLVAIASDRIGKASLRQPSRFHLRGLLFVALTLGLVSTVFDFSYFAIFRMFGEQSLQTLWFTESVLTELVLIYSIRTWKPFWKANAPGRILVGLTVLAGAAALVLPQLPIGQRLFSFVAPTLPQLGIVIALVICYLLVNDFIKIMFAKRLKSMLV